jgi:hypothetical protein
MCKEVSLLWKAALTVLKTKLKKKEEKIVLAN